MEMAMMVFQGLGVGGGAAAPVVSGVAQAAGPGLTFAKLLGGTATVLGMVQEYNAGQADAEAAELAAADAAAEQPLETLQGINRRTGIKAEMMQRVGELDTAYAASGTDLSFGTPSQARREAFREGDLGITSDAGTQMTRQARLAEREANYLKTAKRARSRGALSAAVTGLTGFSRLSELGG